MTYTTDDLKEFALSIGFEHIGVCESKKLDQEARQLESWLNKNYHGQMSYLERYFDLRIDPSKLLPGTKSIIVLSVNYFQEDLNFEDHHAKVSRYAQGEDYHRVIKRKAKEIIHWMKEHYGDITARAFVDSGPVMERVWAHASGIAWSGKNTLSINPKSGSYFFLCCILTDLVFEYDAPIKDYCGTCRKCIDACPTDAFSKEGYLMDASKCISYLNIELKENIPVEFKGQMNNWIFGCDICQEVCPWNRFSKQTKIKEFEDQQNLRSMDFEEWLSMNEEEFNKIFAFSALKRKGLKGIQNTIEFIKTQ